MEHITDFFFKKPQVSSAPEKFINGFENVGHVGGVNNVGHVGRVANPTYYGNYNRNIKSINGSGVITPRVPANRYTTTSVINNLVNNNIPPLYPITQAKSPESTGGYLNDKNYVINPMELNKTYYPAQQLQIPFDVKNNEIIVRNNDVIVKNNDILVKNDIPYIKKKQYNHFLYSRPPYRKYNNPYPIVTNPYPIVTNPYPIVNNSIVTNPYPIVNNSIVTNPYPIVTNPYPMVNNPIVTNSYPIVPIETTPIVPVISPKIISTENSISPSEIEQKYNYDIYAIPYIHYIIIIIILLLIIL